MVPTEIVSQDNSLSVKRQCELLGISRTNYYRKQHQDRKHDLTHGESLDNLSIMREIDKLNLEHPSWGSRRIAAYLKDKGYLANRKKIQRLMRKMGIIAIYPKKNLSKCYHKEHIRPYLLRNVKIESEDQVWGIDISYMPLRSGFLYLFVIIDWFTRQVVDYELSISLEKSFVMRCLKRALSKRKPDIINSDQGSHFTNPSYLNLMESLDVKVSMNGKGQALDNAITERFFRSIKYEDIYINEYNTPNEMRRAIDRYVIHYNYERPHQSLEYRAPIAVSKQLPTYFAA